MKNSSAQPQWSSGASPSVELEALCPAAAFATRGIATTLIAKEHVLYSKLCSPEVSEFFPKHYRARGIELIFGESIKELSGTTGVERVITSCGGTVTCDIVAIGIGVHPEIGFLRNSSINVDGGIRVNQHLETNRPGIFAAGE